ncbi:winged helix-turn-helix transcriptional regulator [Nocardia carnea]|uniref:winged helix-turn-helix transcriptional regulator n=1 Tax=Nocardia carnea TaxID=37328 RepID=UPI002453ABF3|nr:helix-turn-helix domain-containing protein [Nocardia carnea]
MSVGSQAFSRVGGDSGDAFNSDCPAREVLDHITSRWGVLILAALGSGPLRFSELAAMIGGISEKMLSQTLRTLVRDGLVGRTVEPSTPPRVSYELTTLGKGLAGSLGQLLDWIRSHATEVVDAQERHDRQQR